MLLPTQAHSTMHVWTTTRPVIMSSLCGGMHVLMLCVLCCGDVCDHNGLLGWRSVANLHRQEAHTGAVIPSLLSSNHSLSASLVLLLRRGLCFVQQYK